jgi:hypothetical protein
VGKATDHRTAGYLAPSAAALRVYTVSPIRFADVVYDPL